MLLGLVLRNLIENALSHTPAGTSIEVQLDPQRTLAAGLRHRRPPARATAPPDAPRHHALGLGSGHRVVEKIAAIHGARFAEVPAPAGFSRCYRVVFGSSASQGLSRRQPDCYLN